MFDGQVAAIGNKSKSKGYDAEAEVSVSYHTILLFVNDVFVHVSCSSFQAFGKLGFTNESKALIGLYHGTTHCKKNHYGIPEKKVKSVLVVKFS